MKITQGFTIIELMIYVVLSLLLALSLTSLLITTKQTTNTVNAINMVQSNGLSLLSSLRYEIQNAGYKGNCLAVVADENTVVVSNLDEILYNFNFPVMGWETYKPNISALTDWAQEGSILLVQYSSNNADELKNANGEARVSISSIDTCKSTIKKNTPNNIAENDVLKVYLMHSYIYYLTDDNTDKNTFSLTRLNFDMTTGSDYSKPTKEVIMEGIKKFEVRYSTFSLPDKWQTADEITNDNSWDEVSRLQVSFIVADSQKNVLTDSKQVIMADGETVLIDNARAADIFVDTIDIRNRILNQ